MKKAITPGLILIVAGLYFLVDALPGVDLPGSAFFLAVGLALLVARLTTGLWGLSIAGFVVFCLGAGWTALALLNVPGMYGIVATLLSLALAFLLIHICEFRRIGHWPLIPALILLVFGVFFFLVLTPEINALLRPYYGLILPVVLIALGVWLLVRGMRRARRPRPTVSHAQPVPPIAPEAPVQEPAAATPEQEAEAVLAHADAAASAEGEAAEAAKDVAAEAPAAASDDEVPTEAERKDTL
ncbi:MAG: hypothetical protein ACOX83_07635 [Candidatus Spyradocola sp.]